MHTHTHTYIYIYMRHSWTSWTWVDYPYWAMVINTLTWFFFFTCFDIFLQSDHSIKGLPILVWTWWTIITYSRSSPASGVETTCPCIRHGLCAHCTAEAALQDQGPTLWGALFCQNWLQGKGYSFQILLKCLDFPGPKWITSWMDRFDMFWLDFCQRGQKNINEWIDFFQ